MSSNNTKASKLNYEGQLSILKTVHKSPFQLFTVIILTIVICEALAMNIITFMGPFHPEWHAVILDAILMTLLVSPMLYFLLFRPMLQYIGIAEQKGELLRVSEEKFRNLAECSPNMIFIYQFVNHKGRVAYTNKRCEDIMGYKIEEFCSPDFDLLAIIAPEHKDLIKANLGRHILGEEIAPYQCTLITKEGNRIESIISTKLIQHEDKNAILGIITDITKIRQAEHMMMQQEKLAGMGQLAAGVAHEIKNPLNIISGNIQILDMEEKDAEKKKILKTVLQQIDRSVKIIDNLLDFARKRKHEIKDIDINSLIEKTIQLVEYEMRTENIIFVRDFQKDIPLIKGDPDELAQVFLNMINNSRDAMNEKQKMIKSGELKIEDWKGEIRITTLKKDNMVEMTLSDTGTGIPEDKIDSIFKPFFTTKPEGKGTGLGLSVAYEIIRKHSGDIKLENSVGEGVRFIITLPI